jgi:plastocyanin
MKRSAIALCLLGSSATTLLLVGQAPALPGTSVDRIGFPNNYQTTFKKLYTLDNNQNRQIRVIWANDVAQQVIPTQPWNFPYGSILLFESWTPQLNDDGDPVLDEDGRFIPTALTTIFAMKKERGFGAEYGPIQNGEWEYVSYNPDGTFATAPSASGSCALCHQRGSSAPMTANLPSINAKNDYVFRVEQMFSGGTGGSTLTIYNDDTIVHTVVIGDGTVASDFMGTGAAFTVKFNQPGTIPIRCSLHNRMRGTIIVDPADDATTSSLGHPSR